MCSPVLTGSVHSTYDLCAELCVVWADMVILSFQPLFPGVIVVLGRQGPGQRPASLTQRTAANTAVGQGPPSWAPRHFISQELLPSYCWAWKGLLGLSQLVSLMSNLEDWGVRVLHPSFPEFLWVSNAILPTFFIMTSFIYRHFLIPRKWLATQSAFQYLRGGFVPPGKINFFQIKG